jgi:hypothetical protein
MGSGRRGIGGEWNRHTLCACWGEEGGERGNAKGGGRAGGADNSQSCGACSRSLAQGNTNSSTAVITAQLLCTVCVLEACPSRCKNHTRQPKGMGVCVCRHSQPTRASQQPGGTWKPLIL